jgi:hypothetical protein
MNDIPTPTPTPSPTPTPTPDAWHAGVADDIKGFWQNKGLPLDNPKEFGIKLTELYKGAEKFIGVPPDQVVKIPKADAPPEDIRAYYERLGAPKEAKDYDLSPIKDQAISDTLRATMHSRGVPKDAATEIAKSVATALESQATQRTTEQTANLEVERAKLKESWGPSFEYNKLKAMDGARRLGMAPETVASLENLMGYAGVMETLRKIGVGTSEATFIDRGLGTNGQVTTREGAVARKAELMADKAWGARYLAGGVAEVREMTGLNMMITGSGT